MNKHYIKTRKISRIRTYVIASSVSPAREQGAGPGDGHHPVRGHDVVLPLLHPLRQGRGQELLQHLHELVHRNTYSI